MADNGIDKETKEKTEKLRDLFISKHSADLENGIYDERDIEKFRTDAKHVSKFLRPWESLQESCDHLHDSMKFRKEYEIYDMTRETFPVEMWEAGAIYFRNHDKDGIKILYLQVKQHRKEPEVMALVKRYFAFMLEQFHIKHPDDKMILILDLAGAGLAQLDIDFVKYIIVCFKVYFPGVLSYMLIYEMPWLFNAAWKVIKNMLHAESVKRIKLVTKSDIQAYIDKDQLWEHMGGTDNVPYKYDPNVDIVDGDVESDANLAATKRVTFAEQDNNMYKSFSSDSVKDGELPDKHKHPGGSILSHRRVGSPGGKVNRRLNQEENSYMGRLLTICPAEELEFVMEEGAKEAFDMIILKNTLPYSIAYKVKTTSPEKYRVRPSSGLVKPGSDVEVSLQLQEGYQNTVHKDKFLVMAMEVANESNRSLSELWKNAQKDSIMEHRLRCVVTNGKDNGGLDKDMGQGLKSPVFTQLTQKVDDLIECNKRIQRSMQWMLLLQTIFLLLLILLCTALFYLWYTRPTPGDHAPWAGCTDS